VILAGGIRGILPAGGFVFWVFGFYIGFWESLYQMSSDVYYIEQGELYKVSPHIKECCNS
jgi:hypothetical protein